MWKFLKYWTGLSLMANMPFIRIPPAEAALRRMQDIALVGSR